MSPHFILCLFINILYFIDASRESDFAKLKKIYTPSELSLGQLKYISKLANSSNFNDVLDNILVPRVVGTPTHNKVHNYIVSKLEENGWDVEVDSFVQNTPLFGELTFRNIIGTLNPNADRFLVLSCHYDSKYFSEGEFLGATDSAVPCAMMLNLIHVMRNELNSAKQNSDVSLKFIFFDGEEAFVKWGPNDSIYGAKHLAQKMQFKRAKLSNGLDVSELERIDLLILLDLLGAPNPRFYSFFRDTEKWHKKLTKTEQRLSSVGELKKSFSSSNRRYFQSQSVPSYIEDDHIPFLERGVPILHVIPTPFPDVWHTLDDNRSAIDIHTVENLNKVLRVFVSEYLNLLV